MGGKTDEKRMRFQIGSFVNKQHKFSNDVTLLTLPYLTQVALQSVTPTSITNKHRPFDILFFSCFLVDAIFPLYMLLSTDQIGIMFFPSSISRLVGHFFFFFFFFLRFFRSCCSDLIAHLSCQYPFYFWGVLLLQRVFTWPLGCS